MKKTIIRALSVSAISAASLLAMTGCGVKGATYEKGTPVKVGLICLHDKNSTYDANFINALDEAVKALGAEKVTYTEDCLLTGIEEDEHCYEAAKDLVKKGCNVIFADSFGHQDHMLKAAKEWPTVTFCHATGTNAKTANLDNYHNAFASIYQGRYLAGYAAGARIIADAESGVVDISNGFKVGYVGAFPYAEVKSGYTSWFLGLRGAFDDFFAEAPEGYEYDTSKIEMDVRFTNSWYDPAKEAEAATALINDGAILISQHADSMGAPGVCEDLAKKQEQGQAGGKDIPDVTYNIETGTDCPRTYLAYSRINWAPYYQEVVNSLFEGRAIKDEKNHNWTGTLSTGSVEYNVNWNNVVKNVPDEYKEGTLGIIKGFYAATEKALKEGTRKVFDTSKFTLDAEVAKKAGAKIDDNGHVTSYLADTDGDFVGDTQVIVAGTGSAPSFFNESIECSAPYFDLDIKGINLPASN